MTALCADDCPCQGSGRMGEHIIAARVGGQGHPGYIALLDELRALHLEKSGGYGTSGDPFANFTAVAAASGEPRYRYPTLRIIEKCVRVLSLIAQGRDQEADEEFPDIAGLALCAEAMRRDDAYSYPAEGQ